MELIITINFHYNKRETKRRRRKKFVGQVKGVFLVLAGKAAEYSIGSLKLEC